MKTVCIIVNYNDEGRTIAQLERIKGYPCLDRIIVVDNASAQTSRIRLLSYIEHDETGRLELISREENGGYGAGNNAGLARAGQLGARYALIANPDAKFSQETAAQLIKIMDQHDELAVIAPVMVMPDAHGDQLKPGSYANTIMAPVAWPLRPWWKELLEMGPLSRRIFNSILHYPEEYYLKRYTGKSCDEASGVSDSKAVDTDIRVLRKKAGIPGRRKSTGGVGKAPAKSGKASTKPGKASMESDSAEYASCVYVDAVPGSLLLTDVAKVRGVGGYDEEMFLYGEETLLARRLADAGYRTALCLKQRYIHCHTGELPSMRSQLEREKSMKYYMRRYLGAGELSLRIADAMFEVIHAQMRLRELAQMKLTSSKKWKRGMLGTHGTFWQVISGK